MTEKKPTPKKSAARLKSDALLSATEMLSNRVGTLADAVQTNNYKIDLLQREVNQKPDDQEVKFITGLASEERKRHLKWAVTTALITSVVSGAIAYEVATEQGIERCEVNAQNINTLVSIIDRPGLRDQYLDEIADLRSNRNDC